MAAENLGLVSAIKLFLSYERGTYSNGVRLYIKKLSRDLFLRGAPDKGIVSHFYRPGYRIRDNKKDQVRTIIDAGANIGDETMRFRFFHPDAKIIAIEPDPDNFKFLQQNLSTDDKIVLLDAGLWSHECHLKVVPGLTKEMSTVIEVDPSTDYDIKAVSIPSLMKSFEISEIDILKMDIEGAEYQVFSSPQAKEWMKQVKVLIFECPDNDRPGATAQIFQAAGTGFNCYLQGENLVLIRRDVTWTVESDQFLIR